MTHPTPDANTLVELAERVEAATGPDRKIDAAICREIDLPLCVEPDCLPDVMLKILDRIEGGSEPEWDDDPDCPFYTHSLDAAMTLVPEGFYWSVDARSFAMLSMRLGEGKPYFSPLNGGPTAATPALALTAACLRARAAAESAK
jgi:hypothetical protein